MATRIPTLLESSIITNAAGLSAQVRSHLGAAGSADVQAALVPLQTQVASISAVNLTQSSQIAAISGALPDLSPYALSATVADVSANLATDIANVDAQLAIVQADAIQVVALSTAATGAATWFLVSISGANYKIAGYVS